MEDNGCISINAGKFHRKIENSGIKITSVKGLGYENDCVQLGEATQAVPNMWFTNRSPRAEYDFIHLMGEKRLFMFMLYLCSLLIPNMIHVSVL